MAANALTGRLQQVIRAIFRTSRDPGDFADA